jgi:hypothetical protein
MLQKLEKQGYAKLDEREKVRYLIDGIKNDKLDGVKTTIWSNPALRRDFDGCVDLFRTSLKHATQLTHPWPSLQRTPVVEEDGGDVVEAAEVAGDAETLISGAIPLITEAGDVATGDEAEAGDAAEADEAVEDLVMVLK